MKYKKTLMGGLAVAAISLLVMPALAADKQSRSVKKNVTTKAGEIDCTVTVEDGKVTVKKRVNGKKVKADENDKDCDIKQIDAIKDLHISVDTPNNRSLRIIRSGADTYSWFGKHGDEDNKFAFFVDKLAGSDGDAKIVKFDNLAGSSSGKVFIHRDDNAFFFDEEYDLDNDGKLSEEEVRKQRTKKLKEYDLNRDGQLSLEEYQALWMSSRRTRMVDAFQGLDEDGDAQVTTEEFAAPAVKSNKSRAGLHTIIEEIKTKKKQ